MMNKKKREKIWPPYALLTYQIRQFPASQKMFWIKAWGEGVVEYVNMIPVDANFGIFTNHPPP